MNTNRGAEHKTESIRNELPRCIDGVARLDRARNEVIRNSLKIRRDIIKKLELKKIMIENVKRKIFYEI